MSHVLLNVYFITCFLFLFCFFTVKVFVSSFKDLVEDVVVSFDFLLENYTRFLKQI